MAPVLHAPTRAAATTTRSLCYQTRINSTPSPNILGTPGFATRTLRRTRTTPATTHRPQSVLGRHPATPHNTHAHTPKLAHPYCTNHNPHPYHRARPGIAKPNATRTQQPRLHPPPLAQAIDSQSNAHPPALVLLTLTACLLLLRQRLRPVKTSHNQPTTNRRKPVTWPLGCPPLHPTCVVTRAPARSCVINTMSKQKPHPTTSNLTQPKGGAGATPPPRRGRPEAYPPIAPETNPTARHWRVRK